MRRASCAHTTRSPWAMRARANIRDACGSKLSSCARATKTFVIEAHSRVDHTPSAAAVMRVCSNLRLGTSVLVLVRAKGKCSSHRNWCGI